jgi:hypothetical protein
MIISFTFPAVLLFLACAPFGQQIIAQLSSDNVSLSTYSDPYYGFDIEYPSDWTYTESDIPSNATIYSVLDIVPPLSDDPSLSTNLQIGIEDLEIGQLPSLEQYARNTINAYRSSYSNFSIESVQTNSTISGMPAYEIVFTDSSDGLIRKSVETGVIDETNNRAYYLFFETKNSTYDQFYPTVQDTFDSFQLVDSSSLLDEDVNGITEDESFFDFQDENSSEGFSPLGEGDSGIAGMQDFELFMNSFADSIFNGSSTFGAVGTSMIGGIKIAGIAVEENDFGGNSLSANNDNDNETNSLTVNLITSDINSNHSVTVIAVRIPFSMQDILSLASLSEGNQLGNEITPFAGQGLSQDFNPFESLSNLQLGSTNLINPDWSSPQSVNLNLLGGGERVTTDLFSPMEEDSLDLVFVSVIPYTGN